MDENNMISNKRRNILIAARILYIVMAILILRRVQAFVTVNIKYFNEVPWTVGIETAFTVFFLVLLIVQFPHVFLNKGGKINTGKLILILSAIFAAYDVFGWTQFIVTFMGFGLTFNEADPKIFSNMLISVSIWSVYIWYSIVVIVLSRANDKWR